MPLTPIEMEQVRGLIRYSIGLQTALSAGLTVVVGAAGSVGGYLFARWRARRVKFTSGGGATGGK